MGCLKLASLCCLMLSLQAVFSVSGFIPASGGSRMVPRWWTVGMLRQIVSKMAAFDCDCLFQFVGEGRVQVAKIVSLVSVAYDKSARSISFVFRIAELDNHVVITRRFYLIPRGRSTSTCARVRNS